MLVSFSPPVHLEKPKRIIRERKSYANGARNSCCFVAGDSLRVRYPKEKYTAQIADEQKKHGPELALKSCYLYRTLYPTVRKTLKGQQALQQYVSARVVSVILDAESVALTVIFFKQWNKANQYLNDRRSGPPAIKS